MSQTEIKSKTVNSKMPETFYRFLVNLSDGQAFLYTGIFGSAALWLWERDVGGKEPEWNPEDLDVFIDYKRAKDVKWHDILDKLSIQWGGVIRPSESRVLCCPNRPLDVIYMCAEDALQMTSPGTQVVVTYDCNQREATFRYTEAFEKAMQKRAWVEPNPILCGQGRGRYAPINEQWVIDRVAKYNKRGYNVTFDSCKRPYCMEAEGVASAKKRRRVL